jgi:hypothetical protein
VNGSHLAFDVNHQLAKRNTADGGTDVDDAKPRCVKVCTAGEIVNVKCDVVGVQRRWTQADQIAIPREYVCGHESLTNNDCGNGAAAKKP